MNKHVNSDDLISAIAIDIGGTFTDVVVCWTSGKIITTKFLSSEGLDPVKLAGHLSYWIARGAGGMAVSPASGNDKPPRVLHGTTTATNALLEGKTSRTVLITTDGFGDVLELGRGIRPEPLNLSWQPIPPLVPRQLRITTGERIDAAGNIVQPVQWTDADVDRVLEQNCSAVAICLINSYANPVHERVIAQSLRDKAPSLFVSASNEINSEVGEYERTSTTVVNAALGPVVIDYLNTMEEAFTSIGLPGVIDVVQSNGGTIPSTLVKSRPASIVESGPAAGVLAAAAIARHLSEPKIISFDMGGTTAKAGLVENYQILESTEYYVGGGIHAGPRAITSSGYVIRMPSLDVAEVGVGGGSIARIDEAGGLHVGPESVGASPGPAAYGLGGTQATVTDANVVLGYINPSVIADGKQAIDLAKARAAIAEAVANPRNLSVENAALLIHTGANARILSAMRSVTIERGRDPREHMIVAFGGSGPIHAAGIAELLGVPKVLVPFGAGVLSAAGLLAAGQAADVVEAFHCDLDRLVPEVLGGKVHVLRGRMAQEYQLTDKLVAKAETLASIRYKGQHTTELQVVVPVSGDIRSRMRAEFERAYETEFGFAKADGVCEITSLRLRLREKPATDWRQIITGLGDAWSSARPKAASRSCVFNGYVGQCRVLGVYELGRIKAVIGPVIIEAPDSTLVVPSGWSATYEREIGIQLCKTV